MQSIMFRILVYAYLSTLRYTHELHEKHHGQQLACEKETFNNGHIGARHCC